VDDTFIPDTNLDAATYLEALADALRVGELQVVTVRLERHPDAWPTEAARRALSYEITVAPPGWDQQPSAVPAGKRLPLFMDGNE
jgi:hypothetical protein